MDTLVIRGARIVPFRDRRELGRLRASGGPLALASPPAPSDPLDLRIADGRVIETGPGLPRRGEEVLDAGGALLIPGLWDAHAHLDMEAARAARLDTSGARSAQEALGLVRGALCRLGPSRPALIEGFGHRLSAWPVEPTVAELDAVTGEVPTVLIGGDVHSGWVNSAALRLLGLPGATPSDPGAPLREDPWFALLDRLDALPGSLELRESGYAAVLHRALAGGITGIVDMSWGASAEDWGLRLARLAARGGLPAVLPRIRSAVYRDGLEERIARGLCTGDPLPGSPVLPDGGHLLVQGPVKVIADGSMGTATAHLAEPYPAAVNAVHPHGQVNIGREELTALLARAREASLEAAVHAIGDAAVEDVAAAFRDSGARGRLEHAQLLPVGSLGPDGTAAGALAELVACGVELSVQPAHLLDDAALVEQVWPGRSPRAYAFADMVSAGALLHLGSDAPVAPLDPWLAIDAAAGRRAPDGSVWSPEQRLAPEEALAASVDGAHAVAPGSTADLALLEEDPLELGAGELREVRPLATLVAGRVAASR